MNETYTDGKIEAQVLREARGYLVVSILPLKRKMFVKKEYFYSNFVVM